MAPVFFLLLCFASSAVGQIWEEDIFCQNLRDGSQDGPGSFITLEEEVDPDTPENEVSFHIRTATTYNDWIALRLHQAAIAGSYQSILEIEGSQPGHIARIPHFELANHHLIFWTTEFIGVGPHYRIFNPFACFTGGNRYTFVVQ